MKKAAPDSSWPNSASDARSSEQDIRLQLVESRSVDVMVAVGPNMFYTVLPCTLWFFDKGKARTPRADTVLFIDARHIYRQIDRAHPEWTPLKPRQSSRSLSLRVGD
jgi:type I restriction enzyme M protein